MPVHAFTPIIGTLLLAHNAAVGAATRFAVIDILRQIRDADADPDSQSSNENAFGPDERMLLKQEILQQIVIGIGRLDLVEEGDGYDPSADDPPSTSVVGPSTAESSRPDQASSERSSTPSLPELSRHDTPSSTDSVKTPELVSPEGETSSPPVYSDASYPRIQVQVSDVALDDPSRISSDAPSSGNSIPSETESKTLVTATSDDSAGNSSTEFGAMDDSDGVEAALGRLSSMSLMAAVSAGGACIFFFFS